MKAGEFRSVRAAALEAGIIEPSISNPFSPRPLVDAADLPDDRRADPEAAEQVLESLRLSPRRERTGRGRDAGDLPPPTPKCSPRPSWPTANGWLDQNVPEPVPERSRMRRM